MYEYIGFLDYVVVGADDFHKSLHLHLGILHTVHTVHSKTN